MVLPAAERLNHTYCIYGETIIRLVRVGVSGTRQTSTYLILQTRLLQDTGALCYVFCDLYEESS